MIPWGFGGGAMIAALIYYFSGWIVLAWSGKCAECRRRQREQREFESMGGIISANGEYLRMEGTAWLEVIEESAREMVEQRQQMDPDFDRGSVEQWRSIREAAAELLDGYASGKYGYHPAAPAGDEQEE